MLENEVEIKFRGLRRNRKWAYGYIVKNSKGDSFIVNDNGNRYKVDANTIGQLVLRTPTDLNKFGRSGNYEDFLDVYVGDILEARCDFPYVDGYQGYSVKIGDKFVVTNIESGYTLVPLDMYSHWSKSRCFSQCRLMTNWFLWNNHRFLKPIGNIYDDSWRVGQNKIYFM